MAGYYGLLMATESCIRATEGYQVLAGGYGGLSTRGLEYGATMIIASTELDITKAFFADALRR
jgi:hypothetical protein